MPDKQELTETVNRFFNTKYSVASGKVIPSVTDLPLFINTGRELELAMLFIDIRESTKIIDGFRRTTAAKMYKSFQWGVSKIARDNSAALMEMEF